MRKFSDFTKTNLDNFVNKNKHLLDNFKQNNANTYNDLNNIINRYSQMDSSRIFNEFLAVAQEKKRDGTLTLEYLNNIRNNIFPYLNEQQKAAFNNLVNYIR